MFFQPEAASEPSSALVPFLQKYSETRNKKPSVSTSASIIYNTVQIFPLPWTHSCLWVKLYFPLLSQVLKLELKEIREQQDLLFRFMNFLKQEGAVHVLQFCLTVGKQSIPTLFVQHKASTSIRYTRKYLPNLGLTSLTFALVFNSSLRGVQR